MMNSHKNPYHKWILIVLIPLLLVHCTHTDQKTDAKENGYKEIYINQFKLTYVRQFLLKSYNNAVQVQYLVTADKSGFTEPILPDKDYHLIDSLTNIDNQNLMIDSANSIGRMAEGAEGKHQIGYLIRKIEGKWLDSLAKERFQIARKDLIFSDN